MNLERERAREREKERESERKSEAVRVDNILPYVKQKLKRIVTSDSGGGVGYGTVTQLRQKDGGRNYHRTELRKRNDCEELLDTVFNLVFNLIDVHYLF